MTSTSDVRFIAFYLTQFHPIPENDEWWGKGFTEWTNVTKAQPLYDGHYQPHLPSDLGFYDLRVRETRREQIKLAKEYGIDGFCYHYYWFSGKRLLEKPLDDMLADTESNMPFCLCWANENWTRRWDASDNKILIAQQYFEDDDLNFIKSLIPFFKDPRYIKYNGLPLLIVYRPQHLPDAKKTASIWREYCRSVGIDNIYICAALTHGNHDYAQFGFDGGVEFPPHNLKLSNLAETVKFHNSFIGYVNEYSNIAKHYLSKHYADNNIFFSVFPSWDNTPRTHNRGVIILNSSPENYEFWLAETVKKTALKCRGNELIFINAWNEWAEGCHLEPDRKYGSGFLEATLRVKNGRSQTLGFTQQNENSSEAIQHTFFYDLKSVFAYHFSLLLGNTIAFIKKYPRIKKIIRLIFLR